MNKKLSMAVAGAVMAMGATAANAGITIPAGDWTIDIGGNVNAYYTYTKADDKAVTVAGGLASNVGAGAGAEDTVSNVRTGLLPAALGIGGKTRQNDLDIAFQFTFFTGVDDGSGGAALGNNSLNIRQAFLTFGDKSWGTIKAGRDLGIFGSDAILSDMTLLGVGSTSNLTLRGGNSALGRIGVGYIYADWVGQISYWSPNWNGFSFAAGVRDPWGTLNLASTSLAGTPDSTPGFEGKVSYEWAGDVSGKVWAGFITQEVNAAAINDDWTATAFDIGGKVSVAGFELVGYYYDGEGVGTTSFLMDGAASVLGQAKERDSDGYYVQATYKLPTVGTKLGVSYGESNLDEASGETSPTLVEENSSWVVGAYHPLTKSLNLVAEYTRTEAENQAGDDLEDDTFALGAILFF